MSTQNTMQLPTTPRPAAAARLAGFHEVKKAVALEVKAKQREAARRTNRDMFSAMKGEEGNAYTHFVRDLPTNIGDEELLIVNEEDILAVVA